jgi:hypothetical protein
MGTESAPFLRRSRIVTEAFVLAQIAHAGQLDADGGPYLRHAVAVAGLLADAGYPDAVVAAGLLHDVVEKTDVTPAEVRAQFGEQVAELVAAVTEPAGVEPFAARKAALREQAIEAGPDAAAVFAADKLARAAGTADAPADPGGGPSAEARLVQLNAALDRLEQAHPELPFLEPLRSALEWPPAESLGAA